MPRKQTATIVVSGSVRKALEEWLPYFVPALTVTAAAVGALMAAHALYAHVTHSPRYSMPVRDVGVRSVADVRVSGNVHTPLDRIQAVFREDGGKSVFSIPIDERRSSLRQLPWVKDATVSRIWPNRMEVRIFEREPIAFLHFDADRRGHVTPVLVDAEGVLMPVLDRKYNLPVLVGIRRGLPLAERASRVRLMQRLLEELGESGKLVSEIDVSTPENLRLVYPAERRAITLILGGERWKQRMDLFLRLYPEIRVNQPNAVEVNLTEERRVTVLQVNGGEDDGD